MLIYHPVHDVNHCVFRILLILESSKHDEIDLDLFRLIDLYLVFPHLLKKIKPFPVELASFRKVIGKLPEPFELVNNVKRTMDELDPIQSTAIQNLMAKDIIEIDSHRHRKLKRTDEQLPAALAEKIVNSHVVHEEWFRMLVNEFPTIAFFGKKGLKARSGLLEFRYDMEIA